MNCQGSQSRQKVSCHSRHYEVIWKMMTTQHILSRPAPSCIAVLVKRRNRNPSSWDSIPLANHSYNLCISVNCLGRWRTATPSLPPSLKCETKLEILWILHIPHIAPWVFVLGRGFFCVWTHWERQNTGSIKCSIFVSSLLSHLNWFCNEVLRTPSVSKSAHHRRRGT